MKFVIKLVLIAGIALPSAAFGMNLPADITNRRGAFITPPPSPRSPREDKKTNSKDTSSAESSLDSTTVDAILAAMNQQAHATEADSKAQAIDQANDASKAIEQNATKFISRAQIGTPKTPSSNRLDRSKGIKHSNSNATFNDVHDDEWDDGISTPSVDAAQDKPAIPPFNLPNEDDIDVYAPANNNAPRDEDEALPPIPAAVPDLDLQKIDAILARYENEPAKKRRPLPPAPVGVNSGLPARLATPDTPIIEEVPEPIDETRPVLRHEDLSPEDQEATDLTQIREPQSRGVREERKPGSPNRPTRSNRPHSSQRPLPPAPKASAKLEAINPKTYSAPSLLISATLLGLLTGLEYYLESKKPQSKTQAIAQEFAFGAQQTAAANIAQQLLPGKQANSLAFTTAFALLHACEVGLKHVAAKVLAKTSRGKKIAAAYKKMPTQRRKIIDGAGTAGSWLLKTLMARSIAR